MVVVATEEALVTAEEVKGLSKIELNPGLPSIHLSIHPSKLVVRFLSLSFLLFIKWMLLLLRPPPPMPILSQKDFPGNHLNTHAVKVSQEANRPPLQIYEPTNFTFSLFVHPFIYLSICYPSIHPFHFPK